MENGARGEETSENGESSPTHEEMTSVNLSSPPHSPPPRFPSTPFVQRWVNLVGRGYVCFFFFFFKISFGWDLMCFCGKWAESCHQLRPGRVKFGDKARMETLRTLQFSSGSKRESRSWSFTEMILLLILEGSRGTRKETMVSDWWLNLGVYHKPLNLYVINTDDFMFTIYDTKLQ